MSDQHVIFFDGDCVMCDRFARFVHVRDRRGAMRFGHLRGEVFKRLCEKHALSFDGDSLVYVRSYSADSERVFIGSTAVLQTLHDLGGVWGIVAWLRVTPRVLRDWAYGIVSRNRYRWFGRQEACPLPTEEMRARMID